MSDIECIATFMGISTAVLLGGVVHGVRTSIDHISIGAMSGMTMVCGLMASGAAGQAFC